VQKIFSVGFVALVLVASACSQGVSGAQTYRVGVDQASPKGENLFFGAYYPNSVTAAPGDTVIFTNESSVAPHTITFGVKADRSNQPPVVTQDGKSNPVVFGPCSSEDDPSNTLTECPSNELPDYNGSGFWNSGILQPAPAPEAAGSKEVTVNLADDIPQGTYTFVCILHGLMAGNIEVGEDDRISSAEVTEAGTEAAESALADSEEIEDPEVERDGDTVIVSAGWGDRIVSVNLFAPTSIDVEPGTTVQWVARSPWEPHTITFESPFESPEAEGTFVPGGIESGSNYTGGFAHSGLIGPEGGPFPSGPFELTFTEPGEFEYSCVLHPGQLGTVNVTESDGGAENGDALPGQ
jgi:plastocyanin